jgi:hypothetical protein
VGPELVRVAVAQNQAEAELVEGLLLAEGVPSVVRRSGGADVPDFLAAGARDVLVPAAMEQLARDVLPPVAPVAEPRPGVSAPRLLATLVAACAAAALFIWLAIELLPS